MENAKAEAVKGLRAMADFIEAHIEDHDIGYTTVTFNIFAKTNAHLADLARRLAPAEKKYSGDWFYLVKKFSENVTLEANRNREEVCKKVVTGTKTVKVPVYAPLQQIGEREEVREIVEWACGQSILAGN